MKYRAYLYWLLAAAFAVAIVVDYREDDWLKNLTSLSLMLTFVLLGLHARYRNRAILWMSWALLAVALSALVLRVAMWYGYV